MNPMCKNFLSILIEQHPNIKFTTEKEDGGILPFLDVKIAKTMDGQLETNTFHKATHTGLLTNFCSYVPFYYKIGLIRTLVDRATKICSNERLLKVDIKNICTMMQKNSFPAHFVRKIIAKVKGKSNQPVNDTTNSEDNKDCRFFKLPYSEKSKQVANQIQNLVEKYCKNIDVKLVFTSTKIGSYFTAKDKTPESLISCVVYKFVCSSCNATYIGETHRHFHQRCNEHLLIDKMSSVYKHIHSSKACFTSATLSSFSILDRANTKFQLKIKEGLYIKKLDPILNKQIKCYQIGILR